MQKSTLIAVIDRKIFADEAHLPEIEQLAKQYPWCGSLQVLKAIGYQQYDNLEAKTQLNLAAVYVNDRSKLYQYTVRKRLLERILQAEEVATLVEQPVDSTASQMALEMDNARGNAHISDNHDKTGSSEVSGAVHADIIEGKSTPSESPDSGVLDTRVLEAQILQEAVLQLGTLEMETSLASDSTAYDNTAPAATDLTSPEQSPGYEGLSSFSQWLLKMDRGVEEQPKVSSQPEQAIIEKFIQESPQITPAKANFFSPSQMGKLSLVEDESFVSETLARIYERQGDFKKAARAYKQLALKYPEKSIYFAALQNKAEEQT